MKIWSWRQAIEKANLKPTTKLVLYTLANYMNEHGEGCYPSMETIAKGCGLESVKTVFNNIKLAVEAGFLIKVKRDLKGSKWAANEYKAAYNNGRYPDSDVDNVGGIQIPTGRYPGSGVGGTQVPINSPMNTPMNTPLKTIQKDFFEEFWNLYGIKKGRSKCEVSYKRAIKSGVTHETIMNGLKAYQAEYQKDGWHPDVKLPLTWLNGKHWDDEYLKEPTREDREDSIQQIINEMKGEQLCILEH